MNTSPSQEMPTSKNTFEIQRLYVKEHSCKVPHAPGIFVDEWKPEIQMEMNIKHEALQEHIYEVVLRINITARNNQRTAFVIDIQQSGIFKLEGFDTQQMQSLLKAFCPNILYPYARKVIADAAVEAGFPPLHIAPINFEAAMQQEQVQQQEVLEESTLQ